MSDMRKPGTWWRSDKEISGGAMFDWGAHIVDWIFHLIPEEMAGVCEIPRESSVCAHAVAANAILVVEDLASDRRFANNPILKKLKLRFYAGVPLRAPGGQPVGALCILDTKPRHFGEAERRILTIMGDVMSDEIGSHPLGSGSRPPMPVAAGAT